MPILDVLLLTALDHVTLRSSGPLLQLAGEFASVSTAESIIIEANDSVFDVTESNSALIVIVALHRDKNNQWC